ncbi:uncharacterized protein LOC141903240 [Tubulanus polymorphus]|uniref:uncharacterized protein LOC141903240 n=1 Tax=Tubulanus polymorphus TaxID=672921 RepID=UPI003DA2B64F
MIYRLLMLGVAIVAIFNEAVDAQGFHFSRGDWRPSGKRSVVGFPDDVSSTATGANKLGLLEALINGDTKSGQCIINKDAAQIMLNMIEEELSHRHHICKSDAIIIAMLNKIKAES